MIWNVPSADRWNGHGAGAVPAILTTELVVAVFSAGVCMFLRDVRANPESKCNAGVEGTLETPSRGPLHEALSKV